MSEATRMRAVLTTLLSGILLFAAACSPARADDGDAATRNAIGLIELFTRARLSVVTAQAMSGHRGVPRQVGSYWEIRQIEGLEALVLAAGQDDDVASSAAIHVAAGAGLRLAGLQDRLGAWTLVSSSKTASVSFRIDGPPGRSVFALVQLRTRTPLPEALVSSIRLRWD